MKNKTAYIIDCHSHGSFHEVINQGYLMMLADMYEKVVYIADKSACSNMQNILSKCNVVLDNVEFKPQDIKEWIFKPNSVCDLVNAFRIAYLNNKFYRHTPKDADVFYNNFRHFTALFNQWFSFGKRNVTYMCHAEMELLVSADGAGWFANIFKYYLRFLFNVLKPNKRTKFILLSTDMADMFKSYISAKNRDRIFGMDHCYIRPDSEVVGEPVSFGGIKIGLPGAVSLNRGIASLKKLVPMVCNPSIRFYAISTLSEHIAENNFVELNKSGERLPFDLYNSYVKQMDAYLTMYNLGSYKMTASGALLEAIWNEKPVFALRNVYFEYMFKKFGDLGFLADSIEELADKINHLTTSDIIGYVENIMKAKIALLPANVKDQLKDIIEA